MFGSGFALQTVNASRFGNEGTLAWLVMCDHVDGKAIELDRNQARIFRLRHGTAP